MIETELAAASIVGRGCAVSPCRGQHYAHGYCAGHYKQWRKKGVAMPFRRRQPIRADGTWFCSDGCGRLLDESQRYGRHRCCKQCANEKARASNGLRAAPDGSWSCPACERTVTAADCYRNVRRCKECCRAASRLSTARFRRENPDVTARRNKAAKVKQIFGISLEQYELLIASTTGECSICMRSDREIVVDHCHETGVIRGAICRQCNSGLGMLGDDVSTLMRAVEYLAQTQNDQMQFTSDEGDMLVFER